MIHRTRLPLLLLSALLLALGACSDSGPTDPRAELEVTGHVLAKVVGEPTERDMDFRDELRAGTFTVCKVAEGSSEMFTFLTVAEGPGVDTAPIYEPEVTLGDGECADVYEAPVVAGDDQVTINEVLPEGWQVDRVAIWSLDVIAGEEIVTFHEYPAGTTEVSGAISAGKLGCVVIFYNSMVPDEPGECTRTPGYWKTHPDAWPVEEVTIGGTTWSKEDAIDLLWQPERGDKSKTLFRALVAAKLNEFNGTDVSCVSDEMSDADGWLAEYPVCSDVRGSSDAWKMGEPLYLTLDDYNNGLLCAPKCEDGRDEEEEERAQSLTPVLGRG